MFYKSVSINILKYFNVPIKKYSNLIKCRILKISKEYRVWGMKVYTYPITPALETEVPHCL